VLRLVGAPPANLKLDVDGCTRLDIYRTAHEQYE
jgi:hypothetical protein